MKVQTPSAIVAGFLSGLVAGAGQAYNGQTRKALAFCLVQMAFMCLLLTVLKDPLYGLVTLEPAGGLQDSRHILLAGILAAFALLAYCVFHVANVADAVRTAISARKTACLREEAHRAKHGYFKVLKAVSPYLYISPSALMAVFVILVPLAFGIALAFTNYNLYHCPPAGRFRWVGLRNFARILEPSSTWRGELHRVLSWNIIWAAVGTVLAFVVGLTLALILQNPRLRFRRVFRAVLMIPWAVPSTVSIMTFSGLFNTTFGPVNHMLASLGLRAIPWFQDPFWAKVSVVLTHVWIAFPFNMAVVSAALQSIPLEVYEAARVDGASRWDCFATITFPLLMSVIAPIAVLMFAGNFNNFSIIYLLTGGGPAVAGSKGAGATDILMTWVYNLGFQQLQWAYASALAMIVFTIVVVLSIVNFRLSGVFRQLSQEE